MSQTDALKKYLDAGMAFTALTRARAEQVVKDLVAAGDLQRNQAKGAIDELLDRSRKNTETLAEQVRQEVDSQLANLGLARKGDVERLEQELAKLKGSGGRSDSGGEQAEERPTPPSGPAAAKKAQAKKAQAKKAQAKPSEEKPSEDKATSETSSSSAGSTDRTPVGSEVPGRKAASIGDAKPPLAKKASAASSADETPLGGALPAKKAGSGGGGGKAPAKKSVGVSDEAGTGSSMPAKKPAKKQG